MRYFRGSDTATMGSPRLAVLFDVGPGRPGYSAHAVSLVSLLESITTAPVEQFYSDRFWFDEDGWHGPGLHDGSSGLLLTRISTTGTWPRSVAVALEESGWTCLDSARTLYDAADKWLAYRRFVTAGLPVITTVVTSARHDLGGAGLDSPLGYPCVVKARHGSSGRQVYRCLDRQEYQDAMAALLRTGDDGVLVQPYVTVPGAERDIRVHVVGGEARLVLERHAQPGGWQTNMSKGSSASTPAPVLAYRARELAEAAAATTGLFWTAVDMLVGEDEELFVCEANPSPGIAATLKIVGVETISAILRDVLSHGVSLHTRALRTRPQASR